MSTTSKRLAFLAAHAEYVSIEVVSKLSFSASTTAVNGYRVVLGGDEWQGIGEKCDGKTVAKAVRAAVRVVERADRKRAKEARRLG